MTPTGPPLLPRTINEHAAPPAVALPAPYLLFLGDVTESGYAKTAFGLRDWARDLCLGEFACEGATITAGLPVADPMRGGTAFERLVDSCLGR